jgi:hypothetical protein
MGEDNDDPRPGFNWFVTHKGQGKYFDTEFNFNGRRREVVKGYYTTVVTDMAEEWLNRPRGEQALAADDRPQGAAQLLLPRAEVRKRLRSRADPYPETAFMLDDKPAWIKERLYTWHGIYGPLFDWRKKFPTTARRR